MNWQPEGPRPPPPLPSPFSSCPIDSQESCVLWPMESLLMSTYRSNCGRASPIGWTEPRSAAVIGWKSFICCDFAYTEQPWWTLIGWGGGRRLEPLKLGGDYFSPHGGGDVTFNFLHTSPYRKACCFFNPSIYESMIMKIVHICVQYVLIVCLNVLSTLFSYFSLT